VPRDDAERDLALALAHLAGQTPPGRDRDYLARLTLARLGSLRGIAADPPAQLALGTTFRLSGDPAAALAALEELLERRPRHEQALVEAASAAKESNRPADAARYWKRAIEVSPRRWSYHLGLAAALADQQDWPGALAACAEARKLNPMATDVRLLEVGCLLDAGRRDDARRAFEDVLALKPPRTDELREWFKKQLDRPR
jgi:tetratricopeptide (TPR) repeat protein